MKIATFRLPHTRPDQPGATFAAVITETSFDDEGVEYATQAVELQGIADAGAYLTLPPPERTTAVRAAMSQAQENPNELLDITQFAYDTLIPYPSKIFVSGLAGRITEVTANLQVSYAGAVAPPS